MIIKTEPVDAFFSHRASKTTGSNYTIVRKADIGQIIGRYFRHSGGKWISDAWVAGGMQTIGSYGNELEAQAAIATFDPAKYLAEQEAKYEAVRNPARGRPAAGRLTQPSRTPEPGLERHARRQARRLRARQ